MKIENSAMAGTLESSDAQVTIEPGEGIDLSIQSSVLNQYGRQIKATVLETLERLDVKDAKVTIVDIRPSGQALYLRLNSAFMQKWLAPERMPAIFRFYSASTATAAAHTAAAAHSAETTASTEGTATAKTSAAATAAAEAAKVTATTTGRTRASAHTTTETAASRRTGASRATGSARPAKAPVVIRAARRTRPTAATPAEPAKRPPIPAETMADGRDKDVEQSHHNNDGRNQGNKTAHKRTSRLLSIGVVIAGRRGLSDRSGIAGTARIARQGHAVDIRDGVRDILGTGDDCAVIILCGEVVFHRLGDGTGLLIQCGIPEADSVGQIVVAIVVLGRLHHQQDEDAVVLAGTANAPSVERVGRIILGRHVSGVFDGQDADLRALALLLQLQVQVFNGLSRAVAQDTGIVNDPFIRGQVGQLCLGRKCRRAECRNADHKYQQYGEKLPRNVFHRFHAKGSTSLIPNRPLSRLAGKPLVSFS